MSIILTNYNYGAYLRAAIDSALNQTYEQIEVIVVDDGSTDNSREIIASYADRIIPIFQENQGQASAFNAGFSRSRGQIVLFLDSDDVLLPDIVRCVSQTFAHSPNVGQVQYRLQVIDAGGTPTGAVKPLNHLPRPSGDLRRHMLAVPFDTTWMSTSGNAFAAWALREIFPIPEDDFRILADYYLVHLAPLFGPVISLDTIGACYRVHGSNNYETGAQTFSLSHIRKTIQYSHGTLPYIEKYADRLGLKKDWNLSQGSVSILANRMISLKLDPAQHPLPGDTVGALLWGGVRASLRRFDVSVPFKLMFVGWFLAMALAPRPLAQWLALKFALPESRGSFNKVLGALHGVRSHNGNELQD